MANNCQLGYCMILLLLAHISAASQSSSLYEPSKAVSSSSWSQYKTHSGPAVDVNQCLARCEQHHNDPSHSGYSLWKWYLIDNYIIIQRCNAVHFESSLCEEAKLKELKEAGFDEEEKDVLIRLEDARQVQQ